MVKQDIDIVEIAPAVGAAGGQIPGQNGVVGQHMGDDRKDAIGDGNDRPGAVVGSRGRRRCQRFAVVVGDNVGDLTISDKLHRTYLITARIRGRQLKLIDRARRGRRDRRRDDGGDGIGACRGGVDREIDALHTGKIERLTEGHLDAPVGQRRRQRLTPHGALGMGADDRRTRLVGQSARMILGIRLELPGRRLAETVGQAQRLGVGHDRGDAAVRGIGAHPEREPLPGGAGHVPASDRLQTVNGRTQSAENLVVDGDVGGTHRLAPLQVDAVDVAVKSGLIARMRSGHCGRTAAAVIVVVGMPDRRSDAVITFNVDRGILDHPPGAGNALAADLQTTALDQPDPGAQIGVVGKRGRRAHVDGKVDDSIFGSTRHSRRCRVDLARPVKE